MIRIRKIALVLLVVLVSVGGLAACKNSGASGSGGSSGGEAKEEKQEPEAYTELPAVTNLADPDTLDEVCKAMEDAGLSNVDTFKTWVREFNSAVGTEAGLAGPWIAPESNVVDLSKCMDGWESTYDYSDADCRMTAFLLAKDALSAEKPEDSYTGTYLMFDVDAIESVPRYEIIKSDINLFTTLFGDKDLESGEDPEKAFENKWNEVGFDFKSEKASLLSIVIFDNSFNQTFVGHTGILINEGDSYLFVEKIAFEQPFQATRGKTIEDIVEVIGKRPEYYGGEEEEGPFIYINGNLLT